jgi:hypothetical protein
MTDYWANDDFIKGNQRQPPGKILLEMDHYQGTL